MTAALGIQTCYIPRRRTAEVGWTPVLRWNAPDSEVAPIPVVGGLLEEHPISAENPRSSDRNRKPSSIPRTLYPQSLAARRRGYAIALIEKGGGGEANEHNRLMGQLYRLRGG